MENLLSNHGMLMTVYNFLDVDGDGMINKEEFKTGIDLLNKRVPEDRQLKNPEALFQQIDTDGNGKIDLREFSQLFSAIQK